MSFKSDIPASRTQMKNSITSCRSEIQVVNLLDVLEVMVKNWRMIVKVTSVAAIISVLVSLCLNNVYSATARILPPQKDSGLLSLLIGGGGSGSMGGMASELLGSGTTADMYAGILASEAVSDSIIDRFNLMDIYDQKYRVKTYRVLEKHVDIVAGKKTGIVSITVDDEDPKRAAAIANAYIDVLDKLLTRLNRTSAEQNHNYLYERLSKAKGDLEKAEDALKSFQAKHKTFDITEQVKGTIKGVADLEAQLAIEEVKLGSFRRNYTDNSAEVKNQYEIVTNIKRQIAKFEGSRGDNTIPRVGSVPDLGQQYVRLMREFKVQETLVELLTKHFEMYVLDAAREIAGVQVVQQARVPDKKTKPKRSFIVIGFTFFAGFLSVVFAFTREYVERLPAEECDSWRKIWKMFAEQNRYICFLGRKKSNNT